LSKALKNIPIFFCKDRNSLIEFAFPCCPPLSLMGVHGMKAGNNFGLANIIRKENICTRRKTETEEEMVDC